MRNACAMLVIIAAVISSVCAGDAPRFEVVDVYVDPAGRKLAAYQVEFQAKSGNVKIVGIEGGAESPFREAPYYDARAMQHERVIIAAFTTDGDAALPKARTRVASIHVMVTGATKPVYRADLTVASDSAGTRIAAQASIAERNEK